RSWPPLRRGSSTCCTSPVTAVSRGAPRRTPPRCCWRTGRCGRPTWRRGWRRRCSLLHLVTGRPPEPAGETSAGAGGVPAFNPAVPPAGAAWPADVPADVRAAIAAGMDPDPDRRADLPRFLGMLREARWRRLSDDVLGRQAAGPSPVRLQVAVAV